jgi:hypothetical protein
MSEDVWMRKLVFSLCVFPWLLMHLRFGSLCYTIAGSYHTVAPSIPLPILHGCRFCTFVGYIPLPVLYLCWVYTVAGSVPLLDIYRCRFCTFVGYIPLPVLYVCWIYTVAGSVPLLETYRCRFCTFDGYIPLSVLYQQPKFTRMRVTIWADRSRFFVDYCLLLNLLCTLRPQYPPPPIRRCILMQCHKLRHFRHSFFIIFLCCLIFLLS